MGFLEKIEAMEGMTRRGFLQAGAATTALAAAGLAGANSTVKAYAAAVDEGGEDPEDGAQWVTAACWHNCGGRCLNKVLMKDGVVLRQKTDDTHEDTPDFPQIRGCLRGRSQQQQVFGADRIKYPLKRKHWSPDDPNGELRGKDEWERISWDEALDYVSAELRKVYDTYGPTGVYYVGWPTGFQLNLISALGGAFGCVNTSSHGSYYTTWSYLGMPNVDVGPDTAICESANDRMDLMNSELIVLYGCNPAWASAGNQMSHFYRAKENGTEFAYVGPSYNMTASAFGAKWIRVNPGTDIALLLAVAYVMLEKDDELGLIDWDFLHRCTVGFDAQSMPADAMDSETMMDYILGNIDGVPKTPEWATAICGTPVEDIVWFAENIGKDKRVALLHSFAAARNKGAEDFPQMLMTIGCMGGHYGKPGHQCGAVFHSTAGSGGPDIVRVGGFGQGYASNPLGLSVTDPERWKIVNEGEYTDTLYLAYGFNFGGEAFPVQADIHAIVCDDSSNFLQSSLDINAGIKAFRKVDFVYCNAYTMTTTARYCDIILPSCTMWEQEPHYLYLNLGNRDYQVFPRKVCEPLYESKPDFEIVRLLAEKMGFDPYEIVTMDDKQRYFNAVAGSVLTEGGEEKPLVTITQDDIDDWGVQGTPQQGIISMDELFERGIYQVERKPDDEHVYIAYKDFVEDPEANPRNTTSGKFEIYSMAKYNAYQAFTNGTTTGKPYPTYRVPIMGYETTFVDNDVNGVKGEYPYLVYSPHYLRRAHTTLNNLPWLREAMENPVFINAQDAAEKGIVTGDTVLVYNMFGKTLRRASVIETIVPGAIAMPHGSWVDIDEETGIDHGGAENILMGGIASEGYVSGYNNYVCNFEKYEGAALEPDCTWPQRIVDAE